MVPGGGYGCREVLAPIHSGYFRCGFTAPNAAVENSLLSGVNLPV
jgi:hypothetical protein